MADQPEHRILLLDDDEGLLNLCRRALSRTGHAVDAAHSPAEAEAVLAADRAGRRSVRGVSLIVMDYHLGGPETGLDFFRSLAARGMAPPAVLVTGFSDEGRVLEALRAGVRDVVRKTEDFLEHLPVTVDRVLREVAAERKAHEADALRESEQRLRLALETGQMGAWEYDVGADALRCSDICKAHYELPPDARPAFEEVLDRIHPDDRPRVRETFRRAADCRGECEAEFRVPRPDGSVRWVVARARVIDGHPRRPAVMAGVTLDLTHRKQAEEDLRAAKEAAEAANRAKDEFLAVLSHELRTPLTPVLTTAQEMELNPALSPGVRDAFAMIKRNVELEARLIDDLLDLTRVSRGKLVLSPAPTDLHERVREVVRICDGEIHGKGLVVRLELRATRRRLVADAARLQQVLWNLLKNAVKFTPPGGTITIRTADVGRGPVRSDPTSSDPTASDPTGSDPAGTGRVRIEVADTGIGIAAEHLPKVFDAFEQGERAVTRQFGGLGLGLAITRALVGLHGGTIGARSGGRGLGATFTVELPRAEAPAAAAAPEPGVGLTQAAADRLRLSILLVEDHEDTAAALSRLLRAFGHDVRTADTVAGAVRAVDAHPFDLLISDIGLPDGTGLDLMRQVRARGGLKGIVLSGFGTEDDVRRSREAGFDAHLTKPVNLDTLKKAISQAAAGR